MDDAPARGPACRAARLRLAGFLTLIGGVAVFAVLAVPRSPADLHGVIALAGPAGAVGAVAVWAALTPALVSGVVLAVAAGALFGVATGTAIGVAGATAGGVFSFLLARCAGRPAVEALAGARLQRWLSRIGRGGFAAVLSARLAPGVPATWLNYAAGLTPVRLLPFAAAIALGGAPRTFAYAALGSSGGDVSSPAAVAALAIVVGLGAIGVVVAVRARLCRRPG